MTIQTVLSDRAVLRLAGEDRRSFLQGLITQDIDKLSPGEAVFTALLTPQGKILFDFFLVNAGGVFLIDCAKKTAESLIKRLTLYKLRASVSFELDDTLSVIASENKTNLDSKAQFQDPRLAALGWRMIVSNKCVGDETAYDERRIAMGVPEFGKDFSQEEMFLLDVNFDALNGVSYTKGCFIGQEVTSRMKRKGEVRRRTLIAAFDGAAPAMGEKITAGQSSVGEILSGSGTKSLALIRLDRWQKAKAEGLLLSCNGRALHLHVPDYLKQD